MAKDAVKVATEKALDETLGKQNEKKELNLRELLRPDKDGGLPQFEPSRRMNTLDAMDAIGQSVVPEIETRLFGRVEIDASVCNSCGMCAVFCPTGALSKSPIKPSPNADGTPDGGSFLEFSCAECVQCGLCVDACMKKCITVSPQVRTAEQIQAAPFEAVYPQTEGLTSSVISRCIRQLLPHAELLPDPLPPEMLQKYRLLPKAEAVRAIHCPATEEQAAAARRRLIYEELLVLQLGIGRMRSRGAAVTGAPMRRADPVPFWQSLPFAPTGAQRRAVEEILNDMASETAMNRLLQGDVGSGKTLVAAAAIWACIRAGYQAALLAPTEILAAQHAEGLNRLLAPFGMRVALLTGGMKAAARRTTLAAIRKDEADLVVGTHALMSEGVEFARLGLAVIDEQHRFGVRQRGALAEKAANPHLLVMSATPIPRTLGLLIYGDLDISVLDELPPGRTPVKTRCITGKRRQDLYRFLDSEIDKGRQVYLVCPAIEDVPDGGLNAVKTYYEDIAKTLLPDRRVGLMHGKLKPKEKAAVMEDFKAGRLDALVSTTVIEVGVDVPNASVMVIENAERYGLSALHQLRGRVGRGAAESWCFLVSDNTSEAVQKRLKFLCSTTDGFAVAQYDLETRGPGDFFGSRQHGLPTLQIADLMNDTRTLHAAQSEAAALLAADPLLESPAHALLAAQVQQMFDKAGPMN